MKILTFAQLTVIVLVNCSQTYANFFMASSQMEDLITTYGALTDDLERYLKTELKILEVAEKYFGAESNVTISFLESPINSFSVIRKLAYDVDILDKLLNTASEFKKSVNVKYPDKIDLYGASVGLKRIQDIYHLNFKDIINGKLLDNITTFPMTPSECFFMGSYMYMREHYANTVDWLVEAVEKHNEKDDSYFFPLIAIHDILAESYAKQQDFPNAMRWTTKLLAFNNLGSRKRTMLKQNLAYYETLAIELEDSEAVNKYLRKRPRTTMDIEHLQDHELVKHYRNLSENAKLCYLCRNRVLLSNDVSRRLKCRYLRKRHPFLSLAPLKMEQIYIDPDISMVHEVVHDHEIDHIINVAKEKFKHIRTVNTSNYKTTEYVLKTVSLRDEESDLVKLISQRMAQFTSLGQTSSGHLQVSNYGVGGYYDPHYECHSHTDEIGSTKRNRTLTVIFYLTNVAKGGLTVFPALGLSVSPRRGSAIFWSNLHSSGEPDPATLHASCPVVFGHKWGSGQCIPPIQLLKYLNLINIQKYCTIFLRLLLLGYWERMTKEAEDLRSNGDIYRTPSFAEANKWIYQDGRQHRHENYVENRNIQEPIIS